MKDQDSSSLFQKVTAALASDDDLKSPRVVIGALVVVVLLFLNVALWSGYGGLFTPVVEDFQKQSIETAETQVIDVAPTREDSGALVQTIKPARVGKIYDEPFFADAHPYDPMAEDELEVDIPEVKAIIQEKKPAYHYALKNTSSQKARIAIIIDDVGMNRKQSRAVVEMDSVPLTLAFLPYAPNLKALTEPARAAGHELMIHMPMEPMSSKVPLGPIAIKDDMGATEVQNMLEQAYASFDGYAGLNNHMGSRATQNPAVMAAVMDSLDARGLFYVDSKTISTSIAADAAKAHGLRHAERDIFLDHEETLSFARGALQKLEKVALKQGHAIAIGHPKVNTLAALREWIPTLEARGFEIVPVSELLMVPRDGQAVASVTKKKAAAKAAKKVPKFILNKPDTSALDLIDVEPAAGEAVIETQKTATEDLLSAPIGADENFTGGLYSLSE